MPIVQSHIPAHLQTDPVRAVARMKVRVWLRPGRYGFLGHSVTNGPEGYTDIVVYADEAAALDRETEDHPELIAQAEAMNSTQQRAHIAKRLGMQVSDIPPHASAWTPDMVAAERSYPGSVEATFYQLTGRGIRPIVKWEKLEDLDPPLTDEQRSTAMLAGALTRAAGVGGGNESDLRKEIDELKALVAKLSSNSGNGRK